MPKISDLPSQPIPQNGDEFAIAVEVSPGVKETRKLSLRYFGEWILKIGAKIVGVQPNSLLVVNSNGELDFIEGIIYSSGLGLLTIGTKNTTPAPPSLKITKRTDATYPGVVFSVENIHPTAQFGGDYLQVLNNGELLLFGQILVSPHIDPTMDQDKDGVLFRNINNSRNFTLNHQGVLSTDLNPGDPLNDVIASVMELRIALQNVGIITVP